jgi:Putative metallopeptidase
MLVACALWCAGPAHAQDQTDPALPSEDAARFVISNVEFTLLHEMMHVLIDEAGIPVLGREEDLADYLTAITFLSQKTGFPLPPKQTKPPPGYDWPPDFGPLTPSGIARMQAIIDAWRIEWTISEQDNMALPWADPHALEIQRLYDLVCLTYGRDPAHLEDFRIENELPSDRAEFCEEDFAKAEKGLEFIKTTLKNTAKTPLGAGGKMPPDFAIQLKFEEAISPAHQQYKLWLTNASIIYKLIDALNRDYYLPRPILVRFRVCGQPNAFWEPKDAEVNVCYELLDRFVHLNRFRKEYAEDRRKNMLGRAKAERAFK